MFTNLRLVALISIATFLSTAGLAFAQTTTPASNSNEPVLVATVNIYNSKIVEQKNNVFKISFDLSNRIGAQPEVKYSAALIKQNEQGQIKIDENIYPEVVNLGENQTITKEITYEAPTYLKGTFKLWLFAQNASGMMLSLSQLGDVELNGDNQYLEIKMDSCYLRVKGEANDKKYTLRQGVDIKNDEQLVANCLIINHFKKEITFTPQFKTYWRSTFGEQVQDNQEVQSELSLGSEETKALSFVLPKALKPQAYDAVLTLLENNKTVSNSVAFYYVLRGASATIQSVKLDKDYYIEGETAKLFFFWTASADSFPNSRLGATENGVLTAQINVTGKDGKDCINTINKKLSNESVEETLDLSIIANCTNPQISAIIKDASGQILDQKSYSIESQNFPSQSFFKKYSLYLYSAGFIILLIIIGLTAFFLKKKKTDTIDTNVIMPVLFFLLLTGSFFVGSGVAKAETFYTRLGGVVYTVNLDKENYSPSETITAIATDNFYGCTYSPTSPSPIVVTINNISKTLEGDLCTWWAGSVTFIAPSVTGDYLAYISEAYDGNSYPLGSIGYTVSATINGACSSPLSPQIHYSCAAGTSVSNVDGTSSWTWGCNGLNGGTNTGATACSEAKPVYNCGRCSTNYNYTYATFNSYNANCTADLNIAYTCNSSCGIVAGNLTYGSCGSASCSNGANNPPTCNTCTAPLVWNGSSCAVAPSGSVTSNSCIISSGQTSCAMNVAWSSLNTTGTVTIYSPYGHTRETVFATGPSGNIPAAFFHGGYTMELYNGNTMLAIGSFSATCAPGTQWDSGGAGMCMPPSATLTASPNPVVYGASSTLTWSSTNVTSCTAGGPWSNTGTLSGSGLTDPIIADTTFTFQCTGPNGTTPMQSVTVGVESGLMGKVLLDTNGNGVADAGETTYLRDPSGTSCPNPTTEVSGVTISYSGPANGSTTINQCSPTRNDAIFMTGALPTGTYTVSAAVPAGWEATGPTTLTGIVVPAGGKGIAVFFMRPLSACTAPLTQTVTVACDVNGAGVAAISGSVTRSQTKTYPACTFGTPVTADNSTYVTDNCVYPSATCSNGANNYPDCTIYTPCTNGGNNPPICNLFTPTVTLSASPDTISNDQSSTLTWTSTNATSCGAAGGASWLAAGSPSSGNVSVSPSTTSNYQVTCIGPGGTSNSNIVPVTVLYPSLSISADRTRLPAGESATISWTSSQMSSCAVTKNGAAWRNGLSNPGIADVITGQTTYVLTCQRQTGGESKSLIVNVTTILQEF